MSDPQRPLRRLHLKLSRGMSRVGSVFFLLWLAFWTIGVLWLDGCAVWLLAKNVAAQSYPSVRGDITSSESAEAESSATWKVQFRYSVGGREFTGHRRTFADGNFSNRRQNVQSFAEQFVVGKSVEVFYNPNDPSDSALDRTLSGLPLVMGLFVVPFNAVMLGGWNWVRRRILRLQAVPVRRDGTRWFVTTTNGQPLVVMLIVAGGLSLASTFTIVLCGWEENLFGLAATWCVLIGVSVAAYLHTRTLVLREHPVFILDDATATVTWPGSNDTPAFSLPREQLSAVELADQPANADELGLSPDFVVRLSFKSDDEQSVKRTVLCTPNGTEAAALAEWLKDWIARPADRRELMADGRPPNLFDNSRCDWRPSAISHRHSAGGEFRCEVGCVTFMRSCSTRRNHSCNAGCWH